MTQRVPQKQPSMFPYGVIPGKSFPFSLNGMPWKPEKLTFQDTGLQYGTVVQVKKKQSRDV